MRPLTFTFLLGMLSVPVVGQDLQVQLAQLRHEVDSLRMELAKCRNSPFQQLTQNLENSKYSEAPEYTREELHTKLLEQIQLKSADKYALALEAIKHTNEFIEYCTGIKDELINRAGGLDSLEQNPAGYQDKKVGSVFFIEEKRGIELKSSILDLRKTYLGYVQGDPDFEKRIMLNIEDSQGKAWERYKFEGMPLAAILPVLGKYQADAKASEIAVLQYLNE